MSFDGNSLTCPPYTPTEEEVTTDEEAVLIIVEAHVSRTMSRGVQDLKVDFAHGYDISVV